MMNIEEYDFSDPNYDGCEIDGDNLWVHVSAHSDLHQPRYITFTKEDVIAMAKHFNVAEFDLVT